MKGMSWKLLFPLQQITCLGGWCFWCKRTCSWTAQGWEQTLFSVWLPFLGIFFPKNKDQKEAVQFLVTFLTSSFHSYVFVPVMACFHTKLFHWNFCCCYSPGAVLDSLASPVQQSLMIPYWILEDLFLFPEEALGLMGGENWLREIKCRKHNSKMLKSTLSFFFSRNTGLLYFF